MDYAEARDAFFQPRSVDAPEPGTATWQTPARALRDAMEPIATICFWAEPAYDRYAGRGLDFLEGYVWGRACVLGEPAATVVASAFGVFEPSVVIGLYDSGRAKCPLAEMRTTKEAGAVEALRHVFGDPDGLADAVEMLRSGIAAADSSGRPMHAGLMSMDWPADPVGRLWHACTILREHRGDGHIAAYVAAGLSGLEANLLTELVVGWEPLAYTASRGWSPEAMHAGTAGLARQGLATNGTPTAAGQQLREQIEATTDRLMQPVTDAIGPDLPALTRTLDAWSQRIVDRGWFPPDPYKRASG